MPRGSMPPRAPTASAGPAGRTPPGRGLPLPLLQQLPRPAAPVAPGRGRRPRGGCRAPPGAVAALPGGRRRRRARHRGVPRGARGRPCRSSARSSTRPLSRTPQLGCFGLHEWAMVYRTPEDDVRHAGWPLRLGSGGTDEVVERHGIRCSHFDAFRFFTDDARPRNALQPTRDGQVALEQPGCLHAGMDVYKWAFKLTPARAERPRRATPSTSPARSASSTCRPRPTTCASSGTTPCRSRRPRARPPTSSGSGTSPSARTRCAAASSTSSTLALTPTSGSTAAVAAPATG